MEMLIEFTNLEMYFVGDLTVRVCVKNCVVHGLPCFDIHSLFGLR